jgi:murein DD-endopeptidase MepM/ murein hydrolase activator NlpD
MTGLLPPCRYSIASPFGPRNLDRDLKFYHRASEDASFFNNPYAGAVLAKFHAGTDWSAPYGTPVVASEAGTVVHSGWAAAGGPFAGGGIIADIVIAGGMHYVPCHLSRVLPGAGQKVKRGQVIGYSGASGNVYVPHVHFALYTGSGWLFRYRNAQHYLAGGKYAGSSLIRPAVVATKVCLNGPGINVRTGPHLTSPIYRSSSTVKSAAWPSGYLLCWSGVPGLTFGGIVNGDRYTLGGVTNDDWAKVYINGAYRYVARPLVHFV